MEILKRARGDAGEGIPWNASESDVRQEINSRTYKAGYTDRDGIPKGLPAIVSKPPSNRYKENYVRIFGHE